MDAPLQLKHRDIRGYGPEGFMTVKVYGRGTDHILCSLSATTAVRNSFQGTAGQFVERTKVTREICTLPARTRYLSFVVLTPYRPDEDSFQSSADRCSEFRKSESGWRTVCHLNVTTLSYLLSFLTVEKGADAKAQHERNADLLEVLLLKEKPEKAP